MRVGRQGFFISHLLFVDNILLFVEVSIPQMQTIQGILHSFCSTSGQKVNSVKTVMYFSCNFLTSDKEEIARSYGFLITSSLGKYLRVLLITRRIKNEHFEQILSRV